MNVKRTFAEQFRNLLSQQIFHQFPYNFIRVIFGEKKFILLQNITSAILSFHSLVIHKQNNVPTFIKLQFKVDHVTANTSLAHFETKNT